MTPQRWVILGVSVTFLGLLFTPPGWNRDALLPFVTMILVLFGAGLVTRIESQHRPLVLPAPMTWSIGLWTLAIAVSTTSGSATGLGLATHVSWPVLIWLGWWVAGDSHGSPVHRGLAFGGYAIEIGAFAVGLIALCQLLGISIWPRDDPFTDRIVAVFQNPNHLGSFCAFVLPLATTAFLRAAITRRWILCAVVYATLLLAGSRGAWVGALAAMCLMTLWVGLSSSADRRRQFVRRGSVLLVTWVVTTLILRDTPVLHSSEGELSVGGRMRQAGSVLNSQKRANDTTLQHRLLLWAAAGSMIKQNPLFGVGSGGFETTYQQLLPDLRQYPQFHRLAPSQQLDRPRFAHSEALHLAAETGGFGLITLSACLLIAILHGIRGAMRWPEAVWYQGGVAAIVGVLIHGLVSYPLHMTMTAFPLFLVLGILLRTPQPPDNLTLLRRY